MAAEDQKKCFYPDRYPVQVAKKKVTGAKHEEVPESPLLAFLLDELNLDKLLWCFKKVAYHKLMSAGIKEAERIINQQRADQARIDP